MYSVKHKMSLMVSMPRLYYKRHTIGVEAGKEEARRLSYYSFHNIHQTFAKEAKNATHIVKSYTFSTLTMKSELNTVLSALCAEQPLKPRLNPHHHAAGAPRLDSTHLKTFQSTPARVLRAQPTNTTLPTLQWVVDTGRPILEANNTVNAAPSSIVNPLRDGTERGG